MNKAISIRVGRHNEPGAIYIGRQNDFYGLAASPLENPFIMKNKSDAERNRVCDEYEKWFIEQIFINKKMLDEAQRLFAIAHEQGELVLGCWCSPKRCHGDSIKRFLELLIEIEPKEKE